MTALPHVTWLRAFEAAARNSSFSAAAEELNLTPAAISQQVRLLEQHLGVQLFTRLPRGVALTDIGHAYAQPLRRSFAEMAEATETLFATPSRRPLKVRASISYAALVLAPKLANFRRASPEVDLQLTTAVWTDRIEDDSIDVEIRYGFGDWAERDIRHLGHRHAELVCSPDLAAELGPDATLQDFAPHAVQIIGSEGDWPRLAAQRGETLPPMTKAMKADSSLIALEVLAGGEVPGGAAIVSEEFSRRYVAQGLLTSPLPDRLPLPRSFFLVVPDGAEDRRELRLFCDWLMLLHREGTV
ncbi:LysR family transcriptional regulator [Aliiroseovarius sp. KMU-50]|uniref:LysR family transcriptional regulator n=1 Tax=Aliiroseovarius salicola TaxID=3009082 RepID=A0ABT4W521_9RHOB|nr:LysR family transcriptional regulator [Aliiroseovarius sp. KMU-50]MDA5095571.1 LysR family transcriptional regulator [Aliiroseovarius sp. KMU-50]